MKAAPQTLYDKIWAQHRILQRADGETLLFVDRHFAHEGSARAFEILKETGRGVRRPDLTVGIADHYVPSVGRRLDDQPDPAARRAIETFDSNMGAAGIRAFGLQHPRQGIVHVVGPELGLSLPGMTIVCGDSHTATHGALGALAFGIGASEASQVLASQTLWQRKTRTLLVRIDNRLPAGVFSKDVILKVIGELGGAGASGHTIEYGGSAVRALSMQARMTMCNMSIEAGARAGLVAPDAATFDWIAGRPFAPRGAALERAMRHWASLAADENANYDRTVAIDAARLEPMATWGTAPEQVLPLSARVPDPAASGSAARAQSVADALAYMGLEPGMALTDIRVQHVFIGSCTNGRIEDLAIAAKVLQGRKVAEGVRATVVPGSESVRREAERLGLDRVFIDAGMTWGHAGCSMCVGMNGDTIPAGEHCASTSNRNFVGRQGKGARTHLVSPATAAASAVTGRLTDPRAFVAAPA